MEAPEVKQIINPFPTQPVASESGEVDDSFAERIPSNQSSAQASVPKESAPEQLEPEDVADLPPNLDDEWADTVADSLARQRRMYTMTDVLHILKPGVLESVYDQDNKEFKPPIASDVWGNS